MSTSSVGFLGKEINYSYFKKKSRTAEELTFSDLVPILILDPNPGLALALASDLVLVLGIVQVLGLVLAHSLALALAEG